MHTTNNVEATLSNATSLTILLSKSNVASTLLPFFGNNVERSFVLSTKSKQTELVKFVSTLSKGRNFTTNSTLLPFLATKSNVASTKSNVGSILLYVASTLLLVWTGLYVAFQARRLPVSLEGVLIEAPKTR